MMNRVLNNEKGYTLILSLLVLVMLTVIGLSVVMNMTVDMQVAKNDRDAKLAYQLAEAGVQEAMARLHIPRSNARYIGELTADGGYRTTGWNNNNALGKDFGYNGSATRQSVNNMNYSVTIRYLNEGDTVNEGFCDSNDAANTSLNTQIPPDPCDTSPAEIVMYGRDFNLSNTATTIQYGKLPAYRVRSTGRVTSPTGVDTMRTIEAFVGASNLNLDVEHAINTNQCVDVSGAALSITGPVRQLDTCPCEVPDPPGCLTKTALQTEDMNTHLGDSLANIKGYADEVHYCLGANCGGATDDIPTNGQLDTVVQDWGDFAGDTYSRLIYIDNPGREVVITGNPTGRGAFIITGNLRISGSLNWEGLFYVMGTLTMTGGGGNSLNIDGGSMINNMVDLRGSVSVNYNSQILQDISYETSSSALLAWKRY